jgi:hypothetical protein
MPVSRPAAVKSPRERRVTKNSRFFVEQIKNLSALTDLVQHHRDFFLTTLQLFRMAL